MTVSTPYLFSDPLVAMAIDNLGCAYLTDKAPDRKQEAIIQHAGSACYLSQSSVCMYLHLVVFFFTPSFVMTYWLVFTADGLFEYKSRTLGFKLECAVYECRL